MVIRVALHEGSSTTYDRDWVIDAMRSVPGVRAVYHALDGETGTALSVSVFDDESVVERAAAAIRAAAEARNHVGRPADHVWLANVIRAAEGETREVSA